MAAVLAVAGCAGRPAPPSTSVAGFLHDADYRALAVEPAAPAAFPDASAFTEIPPGMDRWWLAIAHAELRAPFAAQHFDCALGARLGERPRPALSRLMQRLLTDADALSRRLSADHPRPRPVAAVPGLEPCQRADQAMRGSPSWPASGAVAGAAYGELFAKLAPDRAAASRRIGQELGRSRVICRMNWPTDVADGEALGRSLYARVAREPAFATEMVAAREEVRAARAEGLASPGCAAERRALAQAGRGAVSAP
ncbi:MAG TPA: PA-phosphatase [Brevundimonas sp.]|nr:PA-phosphatase [Brevundimonas sp.]